MHRRHFIRLSGSSFACILFNQKNALPGGDSTLMNLPAGAWIQSADRWIPLEKKDAHQWSFRDVVILINRRDDLLEVHGRSPSMPLQAIKLSWPLRFSAGTPMLGDHWERTYGDLSWHSPAAGWKAPWYLLVHDGAKTNCFGVKTGANSICYWQTEAASLQLIMDTRSGGEGVLPGDRSLHAADIITSQSREGENSFDTAHRFCAMMCEKPRLASMPVYGINDWYFAYGNNSKELILKHTAMMAALAGDTANPPFSVIDAGWTVKSKKLPDDCCWGDDFTKSNDQFGDMSQVASGIRNLGMRPGLWVRPLSARSSDRPSLLAPAIKGRNDSRQPILDPTIPENLDRIHHIVDTVKNWGYEMVKHDFTSFDVFGRWGFEMNESLTESGWHFYDQTKTNAEIILQLYKTLRSAAGDRYLIGCNTMSHLSAGIFELNRIGDDTSGKEWGRTRKMGVNTLGFRIMQHNQFYATDGDCVGLTTKIPWKENKQWMQLLAESSAPLFISAEPEAVGDEQRQFIRKCFEMAARPQPLGEPLDWLTNPFPSRWKLNGRELSFDWS
jgi:alpha-galactosidase